MAYMALIFFMSSNPAPQMFRHIPVILGIKLLHVMEFGFLAALWVYGFLKGSEADRALVYLLAVSLTAAWGGLDEVHQAFNPARTSRVGDVIADLVGAILLVLGHARLERFRWFRAFTFPEDRRRSVSSRRP